MSNNVAQFLKKPVVISAIQYDGENWGEVRKFASIIEKSGMGGFVSRDGVRFLRIHTLEGIMEAAPGDWIIRGVKGEFYPCKPDIFEESYEPIKGVE